MSIDITSRSILTSLFNTISTISPPTETSISSAFNSTNVTSNTKLNPYSSFEPFASNTRTSVPSPNPLRNLSPKARNLFVTAHCLLPSTFLAALDLLDKRLVVRVHRATPPTAKLKEGQPSKSPEKPEVESNEEANEEEDEQEDQEPVYYIRSSQPHPIKSGIPQPKFHIHQHPPASKKPRSSQHPSKSYNYEVRLSSWNCTCIAFTLAAYSKSHVQNPYLRDQHLNSDETVGGGVTDLDGYEASDGEIWWGGTLTLDHDETNKGHAPICKHLLAAVMVEKCPALFRGCAVDKALSVEEMAEMAVLWE